MAGFKFRLDRVLQLRLTAEQQCARALGESRVELERQQAAADASAQRLGEAIRQAAEATSERHTAGVLQALLLSIDASRAQSRMAAEAASLAARRHDEDRARFDEARAARRALEKLREQRQEAWTADEGRAEQQVIDDVARRVTGETEAR